jgi:hypothetical protein
MPDASVQRQKILRHEVSKKRTPFQTGRTKEDPDADQPEFAFSDFEPCLGTAAIKDHKDGRKLYLVGRLGHKTEKPRKPVSDWLRKG